MDQITSSNGQGCRGPLFVFHNGMFAKHPGSALYLGNALHLPVPHCAGPGGAFEPNPGGVSTSRFKASSCDSSQVGPGFGSKVGDISMFVNKERCGCVMVCIHKKGNPE